MWQIEALEDRQHLSAVPAAPTQSLSGATLTIVGTDAADRIEFASEQSRFSFFLNGQGYSYSVNRVRLIRIYAGAGNDTVIVSPKLRIRASIEGGAGNDLIGGGALNDTIMGQKGNDTLTGNLGDDYVDAGPGDDVMYDIDLNGLGLNVFHGGSGNDSADITMSNKPNFVSGIETLTDTGPGVFYTWTSSIDPQAGRLMLNLHWYKPDHDDWTFTGPTPRSDGLSEIKFVATTTGVSSDDFPDAEHFDVTDQVNTGLIFSWNFNDQSEQVPLFLPNS